LAFARQRFFCSMRAEPAEGARMLVCPSSQRFSYGQNSVVGKILEIHQETPGRIHVVLIRQVVGF
jgi:hypothetical protein